MSQEREINRQRIIQERINIKRIKEERKITLQREKEERRLVIMEQNANKRQEKAVRTEDKLKRAEMQAIKRELLRQKQLEKSQNQMLNYISKLFK